LGQILINLVKASTIPLSPKFGALGILNEVFIKSQNLEIGENLEEDNLILWTKP